MANPHDQGALGGDRVAGRMTMVPRGMQHDPERDDATDDSLEGHVDELLASVGATLDREEPAAPPASPTDPAPPAAGVDDSLAVHVDELLTEVTRSVDSLPPEPARPLVERRGVLTILEQDDLVAARAFYEELLGLTPEEVGEAEVRYRLGHDSFVVLTEASPAASEGAAVVFAVRDIDETRRRLGAAGLDVEVPDDLLEAMGAVFVRDPSGHLLGFALFEEVPSP